MQFWLTYLFFINVSTPSVMITMIKSVIKIQTSIVYKKILTKLIKQSQTKKTFTKTSLGEKKQY